MDKNTTGLLVFTNDTDMIRKFSLPNQKSPKIYQVLTTAFLVLGGIVVSAVIFRFSGTIDLKFGGDGGHLKIQGNPQTEAVAKPVLVEKK